MDRILIIMKNKCPMALSAPLLGLFSIIFKHVYWYIQHISGERLQDHWSSGLIVLCGGSNSTAYISESVLYLNYYRGSLAQVM